MKEPVPRVECDIDIGQWFSDVNIDYEALVEFMRKLGYDDNTINSTTIHFKADNSLFIDNEGELRTLNGAYDKKSGRIVIFPHRVKYAFSGSVLDTDGSDKIEEIRQRVNDWGSEEFSAILAHELAHASRHPALTIEENTKPRDLDASALAQEAIRQTGYVDSPEEAACHETEKAAPRGLVKFQIKHSRPILNGNSGQ